MKAFGPFRLDPVNHCLWRASERVLLTPKAFDVLRYLVERAGQLVSPDELLDALWQDTHINPEGIRKYILEVRKVLGDRAGQSEFIETLPKRGYRFLAPVTEERVAVRSEVAAPGAGKIVGRQAGLAELHACFERAASGQRQVVFVTGEAGIGKTTLVDVFVRQIAARGDVRIARGQCIEGFGGIEAYYPMLEAIGSLLQDGQNNSLLQMLARRAPTWLIQFPALVTPEQKAALQREILGSTRDRMVREIGETLEVITAQSPLAIVLEDLHWVDPSSLDLISAIARRREPAKLLLLATYRPVDVVLSQSPLKGLKHDLLVRRLCHEIAIERLEEADVADYLCALFATEYVPAGLANLIHRNSGGNPLFMAAIVQDMVSKGLIAQDRDGVSLTSPVQELYPGIPETLQQMLELQFEQLNAEEQRILQGGSVAGERFSVWAAAAMLDAAPERIEETCDRLANRRQFIVGAGIHTAPDGTASPHYEFRHALYRQALHRSLPAAGRSKLHLSLGERLLPICNAGKPELASEVALHFEEGRDYKRAARCLMLAAENAARRFAHRDSIHVLQRALKLIPALPARTAAELEIEIRVRIGDTQYVLGEMSGSVDSYAAAADRAAQAGLLAGQVGALGRLAFAAWYIEPARGEAVGRQVLDICERIDDPLLAAQTRLCTGYCRLLYDQWRAEDVAVCAEAQETIREITGSNAAGHVLYIYAEALRGNYQEAEKQAEAMIASPTNPTAHVLALGGRGLVFIMRGQLGAFYAVVRKGREVTERQGEDAWMFVFGESWVRALCFDFEGVRRVSAISMRNDVEEHDLWLRTASRLSEGYAALYRGDVEDALRSFNLIRDFASTPIYFLHWHWRLHATHGAIDALLAAGDLGNARREAEEFLRTALSTEEPNMQALAWETKARVLRAVKDFPGAWECLRCALTILDRFEIPRAGWQVHRTAWDLASDEGAQERAALHHARAKEFILRIADSFPPDEPLRASLLAAPPIRRLME